MILLLSAFELSVPLLYSASPRTSRFTFLPFLVTPPTFVVVSKSIHTMTLQMNMSANGHPSQAWMRASCRGAEDASEALAPAAALDSLLLRQVVKRS
jgi:hypothetical protein